MTNRRLIKMVLPIAALLAIAATASAFFAPAGSGSGTGGTNVTLGAVTITAGTATQGLLPTGAATGDLNVTLNNGNSSSIRINSLALDTSQGTAGFGANAASCALSFAGQSNGGNGWTVAANASLSVDLTNSLTMGTTAASSCQGQSFTVYLKAT